MSVPGKVPGKMQPKNFTFTSDLIQDKRHIVFILNGSRPLKKEHLLLLAQVQEWYEFEVETLTTRTEKDAIRFARESAATAWCIVAVGGDGTYHEVVNGIVESGASCLFSCIPNGTGNDYQRMLGGFDADRWLKALKIGAERKVDIIEIVHGDQRRFALNIAGCGFDGYVVRLLTRQREKWKIPGKVSYATAIIRAFFTYRKSELTITSKEFQFAGKALMVAACKGSTFGYGLVLAPEARLDSGILEMVVLSKVSLVDYVRNLSRLKHGKKINHPEAHYFQSKEIEVMASGPTLSCEADGELIGEGSLVFRVLPSYLRVLYNA